MNKTPKVPKAELLQCDGYTSDGTRCKLKMRKPHRKGRLFLCKNHECQRVGKYKLKCNMYFECHSIIPIYGKAKFLAAVKDPPLCEVCLHFLEDDAKERGDWAEVVVDLEDKFQFNEGQAKREESRRKIQEITATW